jgi:hypothetical protein
LLKISKIQSKYLALHPDNVKLGIFVLDNV